ncbi:MULTISPECIES: DUF4157 domain-containing protein [unclassified Microcoleus]|uniref:DUF4157 domain-containing protein n=1 Tax=unclassified Microcoleus TaxID=2642155 RepID=UPI002FD3FCF1
MFHQRVQKAKSDAPVLRQPNNRLFLQRWDNFKRLPAPTTDDGRIDLSRFPTSDWMKNDPLLSRWAQEEAAANSADSSIAPAAGVAQRIPQDNPTLNPELENRKVDVLSGGNPLSENLLPQRERRFEPILSRFPTSDWMKNDPLLSRWAQEEAAAKSSDTSKIAPSIQAKLTVSTPGDKYEQEADAMAARVMAMPDRAIAPQQQAQQPNSTTDALQRAVNEDKTVSPDLENRIHHATGGSPLPEDVRTFMEPRFGVDFSAIRVHTDSAAAQMCKEVGAKAFAVGNRIYYGAGYAPGKNELTAHELTHTVQQGAAKRLNKQVRPLPEPQEMLVAKEINISPPYNNRQLRKFPLEESQSQPQAAEPTFNRISRRISLEEIPESSLPVKQFTSKATPNFNKIQPVASDKLLQAQLLEAKPLVLQKKEGERSRSVSKTEAQIQRNIVRDAAVQAAIKVLETALRPFGSVGAQVLAILRSAGNAFGTIARNPQGFLLNLRKAVEAGLKQFASKIGTHLQAGLIAWLTGALGSTVSMPAVLDARGVVSLVLQVLGINYGRFRGLLAKRIGDTKVKRLETGFDLMQRIATNGFVAAIQQMMQSAQQLQQLQQTVVESIRNWVTETVVKAGVAKLVATFSGFGAVAVAVQGIYNAIEFLIKQANQIKILLDAVKASIGNIAAGQVAVAANYIESTLARSLSLAINFLAGQVGLGNVGQKVREIIGDVRARVEAAVNKLVDYVIKQGNDWLAKAGGSGPSNAAGGSNKPGSQRPVPPNRTGQPPVQRRQQIGDFTVKHPFTMSGEKHHLIGVFNKGRLNTLIASNPEDFEGALRKAIDEIQRSQRPKEEKQIILPILKKAQEEVLELEFEVNMKRGEIISGTRRNDDSEEQAIKLYTLGRLADMARPFESLGQSFGIKSLEDFYKDPPERRYIPGHPNQTEVGKFIRGELYEQLGWPQVKKDVVKDEKQTLINRVRAVQNSGRLKEWRELINEGIVEPNASINSYNPANIEYHVDHIMPLAQHWNNKGNDSDDTERYEGLAKRSNLKLVTAKYNISKGSGGARYDPFVRLKFTSKYAQGGIKGALKINNRPFLDAAGKPLT